MKLKEYIRHLNSLTESNPEALDMDVVYAKDEEGNGFTLAHYAPAIGNFDGHDFDGDTDNHNAICLN